MIKIDFLNELRLKLVSIDGPMREAIIKQYDDVFEKGYADHKSNEEIIQETGDTDYIAAYYIKALKDQEATLASKETSSGPSTNPHANASTSNDTKGHSDANPSSTVPPTPTGVKIIRGIFVGFGLFLFNSVIVLGPYIGLWGLLVGFFAAGFGIGIAGIVTILASFIAFPFHTSLPLLFMNHPVLLLSSSFVLISMGSIFMLASAFIAKYLGLWTGQYAKWNISVIRGDNNGQ